MLVFLLAPFYLLFCWYLARWLIRWMGACVVLFQTRLGKILVLTAFWFISLSPLISYLVPQGTVHRMMRLLANYWMGTLVYILLVVGVLDLLRIIYRRTPKGAAGFAHPRRVFAATGTLAVALVLGISLWGIYQAGQITVRRDTVQVQKESPFPDRDTLTVALVADLHMGYTIGVDHIRQVVDAINQQAPDLVVLAGDTFDNDYEALEDPQALAELLGQIQSPYGVWACWGNHDLTERLLAGFSLGGDTSAGEGEQYREFFRQANIHLLEDQTVLVEGAFYLTGRQDPQRQQRLGQSRLSPQELLGDLDQDKPILVIDHQPKELDQLAAAGADVVLSGHTHNGQLFPGTLVVRMGWENPYGLVRVGKMTSCVTQGAGVWGPAMRVGTQNEIMVLTLEFTGAAGES